MADPTTAAPSHSRREIAALVVALVAAAALRLVYPGDIEFKGDEAYTFDAVMKVLHGAAWPRLGMVSGASGIVNPGLSVWVFVMLAKVCGVVTPADLARAVQGCSLLALAGLGLFAVRVVPREQREAWLWATALACVNPFDVLLERKIWSPSLFPLLCLAVLLGWWRRERAWGALLWGLAGALLGQLEMGGGFFVAAAYLVGTVVTARGRGVVWWTWLAGSLLGTIPILPWASVMVAQLHHGFSSDNHDFFVQWSTDHHPLSSWVDRIPGQFFWVFTTTTAGFGLDYSLFDHVWALLASPLAFGHATYLCGIATAAATLAVAVIVGRRILVLGASRGAGMRHVAAQLAGRRPSDPTFLLVAIGFFWFGAIYTGIHFFFQRHYMMAVFPLAALWLARTALGGADESEARRRVGRGLLGVVVAGTFATSAFFLADLHAHGGAPRGDFGRAYGTGPR